jgi:GMP synthase (glutamine-hydrolysing)
MSPTDVHTDRILILDFGSQYTQLIARRIREARVYCEIRSPDLTPEALRAFGARGIILSGSPESVTAAESPSAPAEVFTLGCPVLGICYGLQTMAAQLGGQVVAGKRREFGFAQIAITGESRLLDGLADLTDSDNRPLLDCWMSHGDGVTVVPPGFRVLATTADCPVAAMADEARGLYGLQFHPEVTHTTLGAEILGRFVHQICGCAALWTPANILADAIARVRAQVGGDGRILLALSGGVDSSVVAELLYHAIGERLVCVFVDTGLLRHREGEEVMEALSGGLRAAVRKVDARGRFLTALQGVCDPEEKRKRIGRLFIEIFEEEAAQLPGVDWLAQGTIYPDVIESAGVPGKAHVIKSHHNVGGLPERMLLKLVEPVRELFKDEVRRMGVDLGLPEHLVYRHPFPGPGLAVRCLGEVREEYLVILRRADAIFIEELRREGLYDKVSQAFAVFLPVRSVGVKGDQRSYEHVVVLRAVETVDFMTARAARLPLDFLERVTRRILNEVPGLSRVTYDLSGKPPATIEWE